MLQVPALENGEHWFEHAGSSPAEMEDFYKDIKRLYASKDVPSKAAKAAAKAAKAAAKAEAAKAAAVGQPPSTALSAAQAVLPPQATLPQAPGTPASVSVAPQQRKDGRYSPDEGSVGSAPSHITSQTHMTPSLGGKRGIDATSHQHPGDPVHMDKRQRQHQQYPSKQYLPLQNVAAPDRAASDDEAEPGELTEDGELPETAASLPTNHGSCAASAHHNHRFVLAASQFPCFPWYGLLHCLVLCSRLLDCILCTMNRICLNVHRVSNWEGLGSSM